MVQTTDEATLQQLTRCILKGITDIFPPPSVTNSNMGHPISAKKLAEDGPWEARKEILGWILDGIARTIQLPSKKCDKLIDLLKTMSKLCTIPTKELESIQGKLQFASIGIPLGKPLLGPVDKILANANIGNHSKIKVKGTLQEYARNWRALLYLMRSRPSHVRELIMHKEAAYQGLVDAAKFGAGGVWFSGTKNLAPFVWFYEWPEKVRQQLCTDNNKNGTITISDLELLGILMHWLALEVAVGIKQLKHQSPAIWCNNINAVTWCYKFCNKTSTIAGNILRVLATRIHKCESGLLAIDHLSGVYNTMADVASRKHTTNLTNFLKLFSNTFPPPKGGCRNLFQHSTKITSEICSQLLLRTSIMGSWRRLPEKGSSFSTLGAAGLVPISQPYAQICKGSPNKVKLISWLPTEDMLGAEGFQQENSKFAPKLSRRHFGPSQRNSNWTQNQILWLMRKENIRKRLATYSRDTNVKIPHLNQN